MKKYIKPTLIVFAVLAFLVFVALLLNLRRTDEVIYTDQDPVDRPVISADTPILGTDSPKVVIVHYGDFQCRSCRNVARTIKNVQTEFPNDVTIVWKNFPNQSLHPQAVSAAVAAHCAAEQRAFWQYHDLLFTNQNDLGEDLYQQIAEDLDLRERKFDRCRKRGNSIAVVEGDYAEAVELGLPAAPSIFINNERFTGQISEPDLRRLVRNIIEQ